jgi:hypothetical protein
MFKHKVNGAKDVALFHQHFCCNFTACFRLQLLHRVPNFCTFLPSNIAIKSIDHCVPKNCSDLGPKMLVKLRAACFATPSATKKKKIHDIDT